MWPYSTLFYLSTLVCTLFFLLIPEFECISVTSIIKQTNNNNEQTSNREYEENDHIAFDLIFFIRVFLLVFKK